MSNLAKRWKTLSTRARLYFSTIRWFYAGLARHNFVRLALLFLADLGGRSLQALAFLAIIVYVQRIEVGQSFSTPIGPVDPLDPSIFALTAGGMTALLAISAALLYGSQFLQLYYCSDYADACVARVLAQNRARPSHPGWHDKIDAPKETLQLAGAFTRYVRGGTSLLGAAAPFVISVAMLAFLIYLSPIATGILALAVLPSAFFQYRINLKAVRNEKIMRLARRQRLSFIEMLAHSLARDVRPVAELEKLVRRLLRKPESHALATSFANRILARARSSLVSNIAISVGFGALVAFLGAEALSGNISWTQVLAILMASQILLVSMRAFLASIAGFARHFPAVHRLHHYLRSAKASREQAPQRLKLVAKPHPENASVELPPIRPGTVIGVVSPVRVSRYSLSDFLRVLGGSQKRLSRNMNSCDFVAISDAIEEPVATADFFGPKRMERFAELEAAFAELKQNLPQTIKPMIEGAEISQQGWRSMAPQRRALISLFGLYAREAPIVFVDAAVLDQLDAEPQNPIQSLMSRRCVFVCYEAGDPALCRYSESVAAIIGEGEDGVRVVDIANLSEDLVASARRGQKRRGKAELVDDDDFEDDE